MKIIPIYASAGITGFESPAAEYTQLGLSLDEILIAHPSASFVGQAIGDSMTEVGIFSNDLLIVDRHVTAVSGDVIVANLNSEFVCKLLDKPNRLLLSASPNHEPVYIDSCDTFSIEGVVVHSIRHHRKPLNMSF